MTPPAPPAPEPAGPAAPIEIDPARPLSSSPERPDGLPDAPVSGGALDVETRWRPLGALFGFLGGFGAAIVGGLVVLVIAIATGADAKHPPPWVNLVSTVVQDLCLIGAAVVVAALAAHAWPRPWAFGLRRPFSLPRAVGWFALAYVAFIVVSAVWIAALGLQSEKDTLPQDLGARDSTVALIAVGLLICVIAPFAEEFFFRGFFFRSLANWKGVWPAAVLTGLTFGFVHILGSPIGFLLPLGFLGFALCLLYWKTGSLVPGILLHCVNNCLAYGSLVDWTWQTPVAIVVSFAIFGVVLLVLRRIWGPAPGPMARIAAARPT